MSRTLASLAVAATIAAFGEVAVIVALLGDADAPALVIAIGCGGAALLVLAGMTRARDVLAWTLAGLAVSLAIGLTSYQLLREHDKAALAGIAVGLGAGGAIALRWTSPRQPVFRLVAVGVALTVALALDRFAVRIGAESLVVLFLPPVTLAAIGAADLLLAAATPGRRIGVACGLAGVVVAAGAWIWLEEREERRSFEAAVRAQTPRPARVGQERILWRYRLKQGFVTGPTAAGRLVYVVGDDAFLHAVDAATGRERWRAPVGAGIRPPSPIVRAGRVYYAGGSRPGLEVFDAASGRRLWSRLTLEAGASLPAFVAGLAVYADYEHALVAVEPPTGRVRWRFMPALDEKSFTGLGDPVAAGSLVLVAADVAEPRGWELVALDAARGTVEWTTPSRAAIGPLRVHGDTVTVTTDEGSRTLAVRDGTPRPPPRVVEYTHGDYSAVKAVERPAGRVRWLYRAGWDASTAEPVLDDGELFVGVEVTDPTAVGGVYALDAETGRLLWRTQIRGGSEHAPAVTRTAIYATSTSACAFFEGCSPELVAIRR